MSDETVRVRLSRRGQSLRPAPDQHHPCSAQVVQCCRTPRASRPILVGSLGEEASQDEDEAEEEVLELAGAPKARRREQHAADENQRIRQQLGLAREDDGSDGHSRKRRRDQIMFVGGKRHGQQLDREGERVRLHEQVVQLLGVPASGRPPHKAGRTKREERGAEEHRARRCASICRSCTGIRSCCDMGVAAVCTEWPKDEAAQPFWLLGGGGLHTETPKPRPAARSEKGITVDKEDERNDQPDENPLCGPWCAEFKRSWIRSMRVCHKGEHPHRPREARGAARHKGPPGPFEGGDVRPHSVAEKTKIKAEKTKI